jgi:CDP-diacylglycerol--glycerol-3-phosphate 3-phosphatidyltransferase
MGNHGENNFLFIYIAFLSFLVVFILVLCIYFYFAVYRKTARDEEIARRHPTVFTNQFFREYWYWFADPLLKLFISIKVKPNFITLLSTLLSLIASVFFFFQYYGFGGLFLIVSGTCDILDGRLARLKKLDNKAGAFFDSVMDRYSDFFIYAGIILGLIFSENGKTGYNIFLVILSLLAIIGSAIISYSKERGAGLGYAVSKGLMQRADRVTVISAGAIISPLLNGIFNWLGYNYLSKYYISLAFALFLVAFFSNRTSIIRIYKIYHELKKI